ncbi:MAG: hypothetical protein RMM08_05425 [Armatimonadota bacterium]|nr:hypothetical protein [bacterium]MDW8320782.1 hypothetical protein [Armatimonadota bacterium]
MNRLTIIVIVLLLAGGAVIFKLATYNPAAHETMIDMSDLSTWEPTTAQIRTQLDPGASALERKQHYGRLFRSRYRNKDMAVNLRVDKKGVFYLECAATIPTWDKALIAHQAWSEIRELFDEQPRVIIYESYIGTFSRRVGEARADTKNPSAPEVVFDTGWHLRRKPQPTDFLGRLPGS